jgi:biopolymer transport protein ExbD
MAAVQTAGKKSDTIYVNVVNMIDILIILLVFLLTNFATSTFEDVTTLPAKMPVFGPPSGEPPPPGKKEIQNLEVRMQEEKGFQIVVTITGEMPSAIDVPNKPNKEFDFEKLSEELYKIKQAYEARQDILLEAEKKLQFDKIIKAMDACRDKVVTGAGQKMTYPLFPSVALTDLPF